MSSLLPRVADPLLGVASERTHTNYTFDNLKRGSSPLDLKLQLKPVQVASVPTSRLKAETYYSNAPSLQITERKSADSRSSQNDAEDLARQLPTPRGGAGGAVYPGALRPGSISDLSRDKNMQNETFGSAAERKTMRNKVASGLATHEPQTQRQTQAPGATLDAMASGKIIRLDSSGKTSSPFSSPAKSNGKARPILPTATQPIITELQPHHHNITEHTDLDSGDGSSSAGEHISSLKLGNPIKTKRGEHQSASQEYCQYRGQQLPKQYRSTFTQNKFRKADDETVYSQRLFLSKECAQSEDRRMLPVLIVNLDGAVGYWQVQQKAYVLREGVVDSLIQLSHDFRIVAVSSQSQKLIFKLIHGLMNMPSA